MKNRVYYKELSNAEITPNRSIVISALVQDGYRTPQQLEGFTIAQQLKVEGTRVFMKGAFHIEDLEGMYNLRNALNVAINAVEGNAQNTRKDMFYDEDWDVMLKR